MAKIIVLLTLQCLQVFIAMKRFSGLLSRSAVAAALQDELQALVLQIDQYIDSLQSDFEQRAQVGDDQYDLPASMPAYHPAWPPDFLPADCLSNWQPELTRVPVSLQACLSARLPA